VTATVLCLALPAHHIYAFTTRTPHAHATCTRTPRHTHTHTLTLPVPDWHHTRTFTHIHAHLPFLYLVLRTTACRHRTHLARAFTFCPLLLCFTSLLSTTGHAHARTPTLCALDGLPACHACACHLPPHLYTRLPADGRTSYLPCPGLVNASLPPPPRAGLVDKKKERRRRTTEVWAEQAGREYNTKGADILLLPPSMPYYLMTYRLYIEHATIPTNTGFAGHGRHMQHCGAYLFGASAGQTQALLYTQPVLLTGILYFTHDTLRAILTPVVDHTHYRCPTRLEGRHTWLQPHSVVGPTCCTTAQLLHHSIPIIHTSNRQQVCAVLSIPHGPLVQHLHPPRMLPWTRYAHQHTHGMGTCPVLHFAPFRTLSMHCLPCHHTTPLQHLFHWGCWQAWVASRAWGVVYYLPLPPALAVPTFPVCPFPYLRLSIHPFLDSCHCTYICQRLNAGVRGYLP